MNYFSQKLIFFPYIRSYLLTRVYILNCFIQLDISFLPGAGKKGQELKSARKK